MIRIAEANDMNSVKKWIASVLGLIICISILSGCGSPVSKPFYTVEDIIEKCGFKEVYEHDRIFADVKCHELTKANRGYREDYYDYMTFYIFDTVEDAESAYKETEDWFKKDDFRSGPDYRCGWLKDTYDCYVYEYIHISGNLIITAELEYHSNYYEEGDETVTTTPTKKINRDAFIDFVEKQFP